MANDCIPYFEPGERISGEATGTIEGKRFARCTAAPGAKGLFKFTRCGAGEKADGVNVWDVTVGALLSLIGSPGMIVPVTSGAAITAGTEVASDASGRAVSVDSGSGAVAASLVTGTVGANNAIEWTARELGDAGEEITVTIVDPAGNNVALSVDVDGRDIVVTGATDGASALTSTAALVIAAIQEHDTASQLVDVANEGASSGAGVVLAVAETPLAAGSEAVADGIALGKAYTTVGASGLDVAVKLY